MSWVFGRYKNLILFDLFKKKNCYSIACPSITSSTASCLSAIAKLQFLAFTAT